MAQLIIVYWRDIPAQVICKKGRRDQVKIQLEERFEKAIDRAAMRGDARDTDDYLAEWRKADPIEVSDDLEAEARKVADQLEADFDDERLKELVANGGRV
ncbi:MAG: virulence factor [Alphaproteobacteria bacterium]|nr:virulence factor [Alphaproteobacteria bacterium]